MTYIRTLIDKLKTWIVMLITFGFTQDLPIAPEIENGFSTASNITNSIMNPNQLSTSQSVSFMTSSANGMSQSFGMFTNNFQYKISEKIRVKYNK